MNPRRKGEPSLRKSLGATKDAKEVLVAFYHLSYEY